MCVERLELEYTRRKIYGKHKQCGLESLLKSIDGTANMHLRRLEYDMVSTWLDSLTYWHQ